MKVAVVGLGYVGTVTAACLAAHGHEVWGVDVDAAKVGEIRAGRSPVAEPGLDDLVAKAVAAGTLRASTTCADALDGAEISLVCVGTPSTARGATDLTYIARAVDDIVAAMATAVPPESGRHSVVIRSTVPPGTIDDVVIPALAAGAGRGPALGAAMCPEFLREGSGVADFYAPPMIVVGTRDPVVGEAVASVFGFLDKPVQVVDVRIAEALKYACNAFHATKISFANELSRLFRHLDVDSREVMELFCQDQVLNISPSYLRPAFAFGGSCLPKDLRALTYRASRLDLRLPLLESTLPSNEAHLCRSMRAVLDLKADRVGIFGLAFKENTDDLRESPVIALLEHLIGKGRAVRVFDPHIQVDEIYGSNQRFVLSAIPHIRGLVDQSLEQTLGWAQHVVLAQKPSAAHREAIAKSGLPVLDLCAA
jgi:GDP-mannose 6-dehydrogenase